jgi:hypothetical protein
MFWAESELGSAAVDRKLGALFSGLYLLRISYAFMVIAIAVS